MNNILNKIKDGLLLGLGFIIIVGIAQAWTGLQASTGDSLTAAKWNELFDKVEMLESKSNSGNILQLQTYTTTNGGTYTNTSYINSPLSIDITPKGDNSTFLIMVTPNFYTYNTGIRWGRIKLLRDLTVLETKGFGARDIGTNQMMNHPSIQTVDTGLIKGNTYNYKIQVQSPYGYAINMNNGNSTITVIEISG